MISTTFLLNNFPSHFRGALYPPKEWDSVLKCLGYEAFSWSNIFHNDEFNPLTHMGDQEFLLTISIQYQTDKWWE